MDTRAGIRSFGSRDHLLLFTMPLTLKSGTGIGSLPVLW
jgi:hypothetical protein